MSDPKPLTKPQERALRFLFEASEGHLTDENRNDRYMQPRGVAPRQIAYMMWPDSKGWDKRSNRGSTPAGGALGATMPMKAATILWRLFPHYAVHRNYAWYVTDRGRKYLADNPEKG